MTLEFASVGSWAFLWCAIFDPQAYEWYRDQSARRNKLRATERKGLAHAHSYAIVIYLDKQTRDKYDLLQKASDGLAAPFSAFLEAGSGKKPDWVVIDTFHHLVAAAALDRKVPSVVFLIYSAGTSVLYGVPRVSTVAHEELGASLAQRCMFTYETCKIIAHRCCAELEPESVPLLSKIFGKPVSPVGLLPPPFAGSRGLRIINGAATEKGDALVSWLDRQPDKSVVYVALGSEAPLSTELVHEMALGLELTGTRFLWALRKPSGVPDGDVDILPVRKRFYSLVRKPRWTYIDWGARPSLEYKLRTYRSLGFGGLDILRDKRERGV
ncbi:UDP-glycosyltransferase 91B1-like [Triticum aestivum]|uniref:UDP-glycosyltransferase 91B1-like n=1 Tax=Triticum aestivum TaxID=4565 RepID=UPI001D01CF8F|nr:UDP-glycosyltransferase 91B1-like [Triticum aestivum]